MYCENYTCRRTGLNKDEVEKDQKSKLLLCLGCYSLANPGWKPPQTADVIPLSPPTSPGPKFDYAVTFDSFRGLSAQLSYGEVAVEVSIPQRALTDMLKSG